MNTLHVGIWLIAIGVIWYTLWFRSIKKGFQSIRWDHGRGKVIKIRDHSFTYPSASRRGGGTSKYQRESYLVEYRVDGRSYRTDNFRFGSLSDTQDASIREGKKISIKINPNNPSEAVVKPGVPSTAWIGLFPLIIGIISLAISILA